MHRIAVFASGEGTNFEAIAGACERGVLDACVALLVCDRPGARAVGRAAAHGVHTFVFSPREYPSKADYEREIVAQLDAAGVELICLAGYMRIVGDTLLAADGLSTFTRRCSRRFAAPMPSSRHWSTASRSSA